MDTNSQETNANPHTYQAYPPSGQHLKPLGRTHLQDDILWLIHSGSGVEFTFTGTHAAVTLTGDNTAFPGNTGQAARFSVYVNNRCVLTEQMLVPTADLELCSFEEPTEITVRIVKLSETKYGMLGIKELRTVSADAPAPTPEKSLKIEFIGDSITCGYGAEDENPEHHFSTATENATLSYAYLTAQALDADYSLVSFSGYGILSGYTEKDVPNRNCLVPDYYGKLGRIESASPVWQPASIAWDFSRFVPDIIVINLGTNDGSYTWRNPAYPAEYTALYVDFLKQIRADNPDAHLLCTLGLMGDALCPAMHEAVTAYQEKTGDRNISYFDFIPQNGDDGYAADWHPSQATQRKAAEALCDELQKWIPLS